MCIAKDKCEVHWRDEMKAKVKNDELRAKGQGGQAAQREQLQREKEDKQRADQEAARLAWEAQKPKAVAAIKAFVLKQPAKKLVPGVAERHGVKAKTADELVQALAADAATRDDWTVDRLTVCAKRYGFDLKKWAADQKAGKSAEKKAVQAKSAKKAKKRRFRYRV